MNNLLLLLPLIAVVVVFRGAAAVYPDLMI